MHNTQTPSQEELHTRFSEACQLHQQGDLDEAKSIYSELLEFIQAPLLYYNLGLVHHAEQDFEIAVKCFETATETMPEDPDCLFNLALCLKECDRLEDSVIIYNKVVSLEPENSDAYYNLASSHRELKQYDLAIMAYLRVLEITPNHKSTINNLAYVYQLSGNIEAAVTFYKRLLELDPEHEAARHMLAAVTGTTPDNSPESYVRDVFDNYSERYEESLTKELKYNVPQKLRDALSALDDAPMRFLRGFDLGCGTGLGTEPFAELVQTIDGVDLSPKMIDIASQKGIYSGLFTNNICDALRSATAKYDFLLATDVFAYIGDLSELFELASTCSGPNCYFLFSTESTQKGNFILQPTGRFAHSVEYVRTICGRQGWELCLTKETHLRMDKGKWINGNIWILKKKNVIE